MNVGWFKDRITHLSSILAVLAVVCWPFFNTFASIGLAIGAFVLGIIGLVAAFRNPTVLRYVLASVGIVLGGLVIVFWAFIMFIASEGAHGRPL